MKKPSQHLIAEVPRSVAKVGMTIGSTLGMSGAITARSTKMEKWLTEDGYERRSREWRSGLPVCLGRGTSRRPGGPGFAPRVRRELWCQGAMFVAVTKLSWWMASQVCW